MNCTFRIVVSDPWDFKNEDGINLIDGNIINKIGNDYLIFKSNSIVSINHNIGDVFILSSRLKDKFEVKDIKFGTSVNGALLLGKYVYNMEIEDLILNSKFVFIGSLSQIK